MPAHDFAVGVGIGILDALAALEEWFGTVGEFERLLVRHGWQTPDQQDYLGQIKTAFAMVDDIGSAMQALEDLRATIDPAPEEVLAGLEAVIDVVDDLYNLYNLAATSPPSGLPFPLNSDKFWKTFPVDVAETQIAQYLAARRPGLYAALTLFGVLDTEAVAEDPSAGRRAHLEVRIHWERLKDFVLSPGNVMAQRYGWGGTFKHADLLIAAERALLAFGVPVEREIPSLDVLQPYFDETNPALNDLRRLRIPLLIDFDGQNSRFETGLTILPIPPPSQPSAAPAGVFIAPFFEGSASTEIPLGGLFNLRISDALTSSGAGFELRPGRASSAEGGSGNLDLSIALEARPEQPFILLGAEDGTRVEARDAMVALSLTGPARDPDLSLQLATSNMKGVLELEGGDGFLVRIFGDGGVEANGEVSLAWSSKRGLVFKGSGGLQVDIPVNITVGPLTLSRLSVGITATEAGVAGRILVTGGTSLGPVVASVESVGVELQTKTVAVSERRGLFGNLDLALAFRPPTGVGIAVNAGPVAGGGFLRFDAEAGRYSGALLLRIYEIDVSAFGIIDTKLPDGSRGFSFAILISARFTPIPLGFGFTLNGVGGMLGINRTVDTARLQDAVRRHALDHVLFPQEPEKHALAILNDLGAFFPPAEGRYTFGPMALIGWGDVAGKSGRVFILEAELGVILELPEPIRLTVLGQVKVGLPSLERRFVKLNFDVVGVLEFAKKSFALDASLYDSAVGGFTVSGDMALRLRWGEPPNFALAVGGFHPLYRAPAGFPPLRRVTVDLSSTGNPRLTLSGYLALTSNTFQVGATAELLAFKGSFNIYGWIGFDALFTFGPFTFRADFRAGVALRKGTRHWASIHVAGTLSGPNPWHVEGEACLSLFFFDICVGFDLDLSRRSAEPITPLPNILDRLAAELSSPRNWSAEVPPAAHQVVSLVQADGPGDRPVLDPLGAAVVKERLLPLGQKIDRFEHGKLGKKDPNTFFISKITLRPGTRGATEITQIPVVTDYFARGQFQDMPDAAKLSLPAFQPMNAGTKIASGELKAGGIQPCPTTYKTLIIDGPAEESTTDGYTPTPDLTARLARRSAQALGGLRASGPEKFFAGLGTVVRTSLGAEPFTIATVAGLTARDDLLGATGERLGLVTKGQAYDILAEHLDANPGDRGQLQVVPRLELPKAAQT